MALAKQEGNECLKLRSRGTLREQDSASRSSPHTFNIRPLHMASILAKLVAVFTSNQDTREQRLAKILSVADKIAKQNPDALCDFVRLLGRKLQSDYMCRAVSRLDKGKVPDLEPELVWFDEFAPLNSAGQSVYELKKNTETTRTLNLASDIVLPWPWHVGRVISCISCIGPGRPAGAWQQDKVNHQVEYWIPFGIGWVHGGNHSIMTGIVQGQGAITTDNVYDLSAVFSHVRFNGKEFVRISDNTVIQKVSEFEFAAIFEVGRLMHEHGISA